MDATVMAQINSLVKQLVNDFPDIHFQEDVIFKWSAAERTIYYSSEEEHAKVYLLHEVAHAHLKHTDYLQDIELLQKEQEAWQYAKGVLEKTYAVPILDVQIQEALDSYRDWLHARSICPKCHSISLQNKDDTYECHLCGSNWRANSARVCALRRYSA